MKQALNLTATAEARAELELAERLTAGGVYWTARERGTAAIVALARALGVDARGIGVIENLVMAADEVGDDYEAATRDGRIIDEQTMKIALACGERPYDHERDLRPVLHVENDEVSW